VKAQTAAAIKREHFCPKCRQVWEVDGSLPFRFCPKCGTRLEQPCPSCSKSIPTTSNNCPHCQTLLQICRSCFRLMKLDQSRCEKCNSQPIALVKSFGCIRGTAANNFTASPALSDELPKIAPLISNWEVDYSQPLSAAVIFGNYLLFVGGEESLRLQVLNIGSGSKRAEIDLGNWIGTSATEVSLWIDKFRLWIWCERWLSCVDLRHLTPRNLTPQPVPLPDGTSIIGACFGLLWTEQNGKILQLHGSEQVVKEVWQPTYQFELPAPLKRFWINGYTEASFVINDHSALFSDEQGNLWLWERGQRKIQLLREREQVLLLPIWLQWHNRSEFIIVTERDSQANLLCFDGQSWRQVPLLVRPSGDHAVVVGEHLWLPCEGGQRWVECDTDGKVIDEVMLPPQTYTRYAFSMGKELWALQEQGDIIRLLKLKPQENEFGAWSLGDLPFVMGKAESKNGVLVVILRRRGEICSKVISV